MTLYRPDNTFMMVYHNNNSNIYNAVYRMSYFDKVRGKGYVDKHIKTTHPAD